jgi:hypothetical protein
MHTRLGLTMRLWWLSGGTEDRPTFKPWDPNVAQHEEYPITTYQPIYFVADSLVSSGARWMTVVRCTQSPHGQTA